MKNTHILGLILLWSCSKMLPEYSFEGYEGKRPSQNTSRTVKHIRLFKTTPIPIPSPYPDSLIIEAHLMNEVPFPGKVYFAIETNLLEMNWVSDKEVWALMRLGDYRKNPGFMIEVQDIPDSMDLKLNLYAVIRGNWLYKKSIDFTNDFGTTINAAFEVLYTFK